MTPIQQYISGLDPDTLHAIISSYDQFEKDGFIGESPIRRHAELMSAQITGRNDQITLWMQQLAFECYRYFYKSHTTVAHHQ